jgi:hypothetical protein
MTIICKMEISVITLVVVTFAASLVVGTRGSTPIIWKPMLPFTVF